jgi:hypothetical protein
MIGSQIIRRIVLCLTIVVVSGIGVLEMTSPDTIMDVFTRSGEIAVHVRGRIRHRGKPEPTASTLGEVALVASSLGGSPGLRAPSGPTPRTQDGRPDFSGVWSAQRTIDRGAPQLLPSAQVVMAERKRNHFKDLPGGRCLPRGVTSAGTWSVYRIVQTSEFLTLLFEDDVLPRQVFLDGRSHPRDLDPTWLGHSVGRWDGDSLVVDTIGFNDQTWISSAGEPHTEMLHVIERFRRPNRGHLEIQLTVDDRGAYRTPWVIARTSELAPKEEVREFVCNENNQDVDHLVSP